MAEAPQGLACAWLFGFCRGAEEWPAACAHADADEGPHEDLGALLLERWLHPGGSALPRGQWAEVLLRGIDQSHAEPMSITDTLVSRYLNIEVFGLQPGQYAAQVVLVDNQGRSRTRRPRYVEEKPLVGLEHHSWPTGSVSEAIFEPQASFKAKRRWRFCLQELLGHRRRELQYCHACGRAEPQRGLAEAAQDLLLDGFLMFVGLLNRESTSQMLVSAWSSRAGTCSCTTRAIATTPASRTAASS